MTEDKLQEIQSIRERNKRIQEELDIGLNSFSRVHSHIALADAIQKAETVEDLKVICQQLLNYVRPATTKEIEVFRREFK